MQDALAQVRPVAEKVRGAAALSEEVGEKRLVSLGGVTSLAAENQVVTAIVRALTTSGRHVIERDTSWIRGQPTVGADRPVLGQKPAARLGVGDASSWN